MIGTPAILAALAIASERKWASTIIAGVYTAFGLAFLWLCRCSRRSRSWDPCTER